MPTSEQPVFAGEMRDAMRNWVTADDATRHQFQSEDFIRLDVRHNHLEQRWHDLSFCRDSSIFSVKEKLHTHGAGAVGSMELYLRRGGDTIFMYDDHMTLRSFGAENDMEIFIKDNDPFSMARNGGLEDVSQVEKYVMDDETYDKREKTLRNHVRKEREKNPNFVLFKKEGEGADGTIKEERPETPKNVKELFPIDARCECNPGGRRGAIKFVGNLDKAEGTFIGVALDEPMGMNDGSKNDKQYFECKGPKYGCFSRHENVTVGDFPELDPFADLDMSDEDEI